MAKKSIAKLIFDDSEMDKSAGIFTGEDGNRYVEIGEWDMNRMHPHDEHDLEHGSKVVVIGAPGKGKSRIIESIMLYKAHICPVIQAFSGTESVNHFYKDRMPDVLVHDGSKLIEGAENFVKRQDIARKYLSNPWAIQILDDVTDDPSLFNKPVFNALFKRGRHFAMIHIEAVQYPMDVKVAMRSCIDYLFVLPTTSPSDRIKIYENFGSSAIPTYQDFSDIMDELQEHEALVIDNTISSGQMKDKVFVFKADLSRVPPNWKFGCKDAWNFNVERMDPNYQPSII